MARITVIISTYNRKDLLKRAIKSVLVQSMQDFELIVVDDCSTQDIKKLVLSFGDPRIKYLTTEKNSGHDSLPKNIGIKVATSDYITFLDDDDEYRKDALMIFSKYTQESGADVVYADYMIDGKPGWSINFDASKITQFNYISMIVACVKRKTLLTVGGFDEAVPKFKDWNLWIRIHKYGGTFLHIPIIVANVFSQKNSISADVKVEVDENGRYLPTFFNPADCFIYPDKTSIGARKPLRVAIYTLTMNRFEYTKQMFVSLNKLAGYPFDWFVIDQGSKDGTADWIKVKTRDNVPGERNGWLEKFKYRLYQENVGLAKGWNNIVEFIKSEGEYDIIVKVDNDCQILTEGFLKAMIDLYERNRKIILSPYIEGLEGSPGGVLRQRASGESPYMFINDRVLGIVPHIGGIVYATPIELWKSYKFDELYEGNKDYLLSQYARSQGYNLFYMEEYRAWHIDGTVGQHKKYPKYFAGRSDFTPEDDKLEGEDRIKTKGEKAFDAFDEAVTQAEAEIQYPENDNLSVDVPNL